MLQTLQNECWYLLFTCKDRRRYSLKRAKFCRSFAENWRLPYGSTAPREVHKRLTRLMELVGVKALTVAGFTWAQKARSFGELGRMLAEFRSATLPASLQRAGS